MCVCVCVCVCVEIIDCSESDNMIEICRKLYKSNTSLRFKCVIFRSFYSIYFEKFRWKETNEISRTCIGVKCLIYPTFHIFQSDR